MKLQICLLFTLFGALQAKSNLTVSTPQILSVYYEAKCIDSFRFFYNQLLPSYKKLGDKIKIELVPSGNTYYYPDGTLACQHGPDECYRNIVEACHIFGNTSNNNMLQTLDFITCMFTLTPEKCAKDYQVNWNSLSACVNGPQGKKLELENRAKTDALNRYERYIPWVTLNGIRIPKYCETMDLLYCLEH